MSTATLTDPTALSDAEIEQAIAALLAEQSRRKPADAPLAVGDRVKVKGIRPKYMVGRVGTIAKINQTSADVTLDDTSRIGPRYIGPDGTVRIPMACLTRT